MHERDGNLTEPMFSAPGEDPPPAPDIPRIVTVVATALEVAAGTPGMFRGPALVLLVDGLAAADDQPVDLGQPIRVAVAIPPLDAARLAVDLHAGAAAALDAAGQPTTPSSD